MDGHRCSYLKPVRTNYESFLYSFTFREQHPELIYGVERVGIGAAQHILFTTGLGILMLQGHLWHQCSRRGGKKKSQLQKQKQKLRQRGSSSTSPKGLLEGGRQIVNPKKSNMKGSQGGKLDCLNQNNTSSHVSSSSRHDVACSKIQTK